MEQLLSLRRWKRVKRLNGQGLLLTRQIVKLCKGDMALLAVTMGTRLHVGPRFLHSAELAKVRAESVMMEPAWHALYLLGDRSLTQAEIDQESYLRMEIISHQVDEKKSLLSPSASLPLGGDVSNLLSR